MSDFHYVDLQNVTLDIELIPDVNQLQFWFGLQSAESDDSKWYKNLTTEEDFTERITIIKISIGDALIRTFAYTGNEIQTWSGGNYRLKLTGPESVAGGPEVIALYKEDASEPPAQFIEQDN